MKNVIFICMDNCLAKMIAKKIANNTGLMYVDVDETLGSKLLNTFDFPLDKSNEVCENLEKIFLQNLSKKENQILYTSNETFISNRDKFKEYIVILIEKELDIQIRSNIQELLKKSANIIINEKNIDIESLKKEILRNLK